MSTSESTLKGWETRRKNGTDRGWHLSEVTRVKISDYMNGKTNRLGQSPSENTRKKMSESHIGKYPYHNRIRIWQEEVYEQDNHTCRKCGKAEFKLGEKCGHHILPKERFPELKYEVENGIVFCRSCHTAFHAKYTNHSHYSNFDIGFPELIEYLTLNPQMVA
jgi:5-methylcytosine-specific restriction endonuclease McrA